MADEKTPPFVTFTLSFEGPTIKKHALKLIATEREHAPKVAEALYRTARAAAKSFALVMEGIPIEKRDRSDEEIEEMFAAFNKYNV